MLFWNLYFSPILFPFLNAPGCPFRLLSACAVSRFRLYIFFSQTGSLANPNSLALRTNVRDDTPTSSANSSFLVVEKYRCNKLSIFPDHRILVLYPLCSTSLSFVLCKKRPSGTLRFRAYFSLFSLRIHSLQCELYPDAHKGQGIYAFRI